MGVPNYVPDAGKVWGSDYSNDVGGASQYGGHSGAQNWADKLAKDAAAEDAQQRLRNAQLLGRPTPALTDTTLYQDQIAAARANQLASLGLLQKSAAGQGPSFANAQSGIALGQGINQLHAPQGNALAQRNAMLAGGNALGQIGAQGGLARGTEMGNALQAYGTGAQAIRGGDLAGQQAAAQQLARQQALGLQGARSNQGLVQNLEGLDMDKAIANTKEAQDWYDLWTKKNAAQADQNMKETQATIQTMAAVAAMAASDRRVKKEVR